jgi:hypothetical protein
MSEVKAGLTLDFLSRKKQSSFVLMVGDELGSSPIQVRPKTVRAWQMGSNDYGKFLKTTLKMTHPGVRRLRLYCSRQVAQAVKLSVHGGQAAPLGRRQSPRTETLTWTNKQSQSLRFPYDNPTAVIIDKTRFFDTSGTEVEPPTFIPGQAVFHHEKVVTGAIVVEYSPEFSLFEISYGMGEEQMDPDRFTEMKLAWLAGNIRDVDIPPVHVIALAEGHATQLSFQRQFWPEGSVGREGYANDTTPPPIEFFPLLADADPCWNSCWQQVTGGAEQIGPEEYLAIQECIQKANEPAPLQYVEIDRESLVERIYSQSNPNVYIDVERPITLTMKLGRADGKEVCDDWDPYPYLPLLTFRFNN